MRKEWLKPENIYGKNSVANIMICGSLTKVERLASAAFFRFGEHVYETVACSAGGPAAAAWPVMGMCGSVCRCGSM